MTLEATKTFSQPYTRVRASVVLLTDWKFVAIVALAVSILVNLPYAFAYATTPSNQVFMGIVQNAPDSGEYMAWMRESMRSVLISDTLTPEPNAPAFFNLVFWLLGRFSLLTGVGLVQTLTLFRILSGILFLIAAYYFCAVFLPDQFQQRLAFLLIVFGSGFSVYAAALGKIFRSLNFGAQFIAEGTTTYSMMSFPLLVFGAALFTLIFAWAFRAYQSRNLWYAFGAGILALVLGLSHGYDLILVYGVLVAFTAILFFRDGIVWHWLKTVAFIIGMSALPSFYLVYLTNSNPTWHAALAQFVNAGVFSPDPLQLVLLMGLPLIFALITFDGFLPLKEHAESDLFLKTWFAVNFFLIYLPVEYQIHFINGWQIPIGILATLGLTRRIFPALTNILTWFKSPERLVPILATIVVLASIPSSLYFVGWRLQDMGRHQAPYFLQRDQVAALDWLNANAKPDDVVLSSNDMGYYIPSLTGARPFLAHWAMTLGFFDKREKVAQFFDPKTTDDARFAVIKKFNVQYVIWSDSERALGDWMPANASYLEPAWSTTNTMVFRVK